MFSDRFISNFIVKFYNSIKIYNYKNTKNKYTQYSHLQKTKNKFYVVKTTYDTIDNVYNLVKI